MLRRIEQQSKKDCGPVCLAMIIEYYKGYIDLEEIKEKTFTGVNGSTAYNLIEYAKEIGFESYGLKTSIEEVNIFPCIGHVIINNSYMHYVVIEKVDKKYVYIKDPGSNKIKYKKDDFNKIYNGVVIILFPKQNILNNPKFKLKDFIVNIINSSKKEIRDLIVISFFITIFSIIVSYYLQVMLENIDYSSVRLNLIFVLFGLVYFLKVLGDFFRNKILTIINEKIDLNLTFNTFKQIIMLPYNYYSNHTTGEIVSKINDLEAVRNVINKVAISIFIDLPLTVIALFILYLISDVLFFISLVMLLGYLVLTFIFKNIFKDFVSSCQNKKSLYTSYMVEGIQGFETVKGCNKERNVLKKFEGKFVDYLETMYRFENVYNLQYFIKEIISNFGFLILVFVGINLVRDEILTIGSLLTFNSLLVYFLQPIRNILDLDVTISLAYNSILRVLNFYKLENDFKGCIKVDGNILIKGLSFSYDEREIIKNCNLSVCSGEKVCLTGVSGSGKSTLCKILKQYHKVNRNMVYLDGLDINDISSSDIVYVSQNEILFTDTILNNVGNNYKINDLCLVNEITDKLNLGYNTLVEENGFNFSGGQKQRMVLARALSSCGKLIIIDEGLSQMDVSMERVILKNIFNYFKDSTFIIISHRLDNLDLFDRFIKLDKGEVINNDIRNKK